MNFRLLLSSLFRIATFRKSHRHVNFALFDQALASALNFFTLIAVARLLGPVELGAYSVVWGILLLGKPVQAALIVGPLQSIGAKQTAAQRPGYFAAVGLQQLALAVVLALVATGGTWIYSELASLPIGPLLPPLLLAVLGDQLHDFLRRLNFVKGRGERACFLTIAVSLVRACLLLLLVLEVQPIDAAWALYAVAASSLLVVPFGVLASGPLRSDSGIFRTTLLRHWRFGKWVLPYSLGTAVTGTSIALVAAMLFDVELVGGIRATFNIVAPGFVFCLALFSIVPISAARVLESDGRSELRHYLARVAVAITLATLAIACIASLFAGDLLALLYGESYRKFAEIVWWHSASMVLMGLQLPIESGIRALEKTQVLTNAVVIQALAISLVLLLLPGPLGDHAIMLALLLDRLAPVSYLALWLWRELQEDKIASVRP